MVLVFDDGSSGVGVAVVDGEMYTVDMAVGGGGGAVNDKVVAAGGEGVTMEDVLVTSGGGLPNGVDTVQRNADADNGVATDSWGDGVEEGAFLGPGFVVPVDHAVAFFGADVDSVVVAFQHGEVEHINGVGGVARFLVHHSGAAIVLNVVDGPQEFAADCGVGGY